MKSLKQFQEKWLKECFQKFLKHLTENFLWIILKRYVANSTRKTFMVWFEYRGTKQNCISECINKIRSFFHVLFANVILEIRLWIENWIYSSSQWKLNSNASQELVRHFPNNFLFWISKFEVFQSFWNLLNFIFLNLYNFDLF